MLNDLSFTRHDVTELTVVVRGVGTHVVRLENLD